MEEISRRRALQFMAVTGGASAVVVNSEQHTPGGGLIDMSEDVTTELRFVKADNSEEYRNARIEDPTIFIVLSGNQKGVHYHEA
jgi:hypothetical protein